MIRNSLHWVARLLFVAVLLGLAVAALAGLHWQPDVMLRVNGQAVTLPGVVWMGIGLAVLLGLLVLAALAVVPLLVLLVPVLAVVVVIGLVAAGLGVLSMVMWAALPLLIVWLIWRLAST